MSQSVLLLLATGAGACIALQAAANGSLRTVTQSPAWTAFFSICGTFTCAILLMLTFRPSAPAMADVRQTAWWHWIGGPLGAIIVLSGAVLTPRLGAAAFLACVIAGQLICSVFLDQFGLMGLVEREITLGRAVGAVFVIGGAVMIRYL